MPDVTKLSISPAGLASIETDEEFRAVPYIAPEGQWTTGFGHVITAADRQVHRFDQPLTRAGAEGVLREDMAPIELYLNAIFPGKLNQGEFDALVSFCENAGLDAFENSTMFRLIKAGKMAEAGAQFPLWVHARDPHSGLLVVLPGLVTRRARERRLWDGAPLVVSA